MANIVTVTHEVVDEVYLSGIQNIEFILTETNLNELLVRVLGYAEEREMYEDCAMIRDMMIDYES